MRFTDELERQLLEAARREERRRGPFGALRTAVVPARRLLGPVVAMAAVALVALAIVPRLLEEPGERAASPPSVFGTYVTGTGDDAVRLVLVRGGYLLHGGGFHMNGVVEFDGSIVRFIRPSENELPQAVGGTHVSALSVPQSATPLQRRDCTLNRSAAYRWNVTATELRLVVVRDRCVPRRDVLTRGPLQRRPG